MDWGPEWRRIKGQADGLAAAATLAARNPRASDDAGSAIHQLATALPARLADFRSRFKDHFPPEGLSAIDAALTAIGKVSGITASSVATQLVPVIMAHIAEVDYALTLPEADWNHRVERTFAHLQRLIIVDGDIRAKWERAFSIRETECEKLGGVQLLHHGIYGCKVDAQRGRTDLVLGTDKHSDRAGADFLVLTEWKLVKTTVDEAFREACVQMDLYAATTLAGFELSGTRWAITVSSDWQPIVSPRAGQDQRGRLVTYRHYNIAVSPSTPSAASAQGR